MSERMDRKVADLVNAAEPAGELTEGWEGRVWERARRRPAGRGRRWVTVAAVAVVVATVIVSAAVRKSGAGSHGTRPLRTLTATEVKTLRATEKSSVVAVLDPFVASQATRAFWWPDGQWIGYTPTWSLDVKGPKQVWRVRPDGSGAEQLVQVDEAGSEWAYDARVSPNGEYLAYYDGKRLRVLSLSARREIEVPGRFSGDYTWSPDGKSIAYVNYKLPPADKLRNIRGAADYEHARCEKSADCLCGR